MKKIELRQKYKQLRSQLDQEKIDSLSIDIANRLLALPIWDKTYYHIFLPISRQKEINTEFVLHILQGKDKNVLVPKSNGDNHTLDHILLTDTTKLEINSLGIPEPVEGIMISEDKIEVVFVPLLAFDKKGNRVGYGKGFYDTFLAKCSPETIKIGLSFFRAEECITDIFSLDIRLDFCVTPLELYSF
ncbi:5-formyltetrahydrofolate cyclo-ligase [Aquimarina sp. U1-2]|uniref:5-formyltetrahydrofolate cyclo-ligase n=1 Tax=Aquimarina sp. U1-2 TaxID=2823141 RepID=UPI001AECED82|nr:5-formyltetrahydrofolate cyclo-ligase [Aquimarina sp. U1-2]MBP2831312.1 5-formyltetrahydrofolate cyclo-ligase [Aquimarina sp. U1-2]